MKAINSITNLLLMAMMAVLIASITDFSITAVFCVLFFIGAFCPMPKGVAMMALHKEVWTRDIVNNLYKDNQWAKLCVNADAWVIQAKIVHVPVAGDPSEVKMNITSFPQSASKRTDTEITYQIDTFYSMPRHIEKIEQYEYSYDKRQSMLGEDQTFLIQQGMDNLLYRWAPAAAKTILTTGAATAATIADGTGNRKAFTKAVFGQAKLTWDKANYPSSGRNALLTADHFQQFFDSLSEAEKTEVGRVADLVNGKLGRYMGIDIYMRSTVLRYRGANGSYAPVQELDPAFAASNKAADRAASLFWHSMATERAFGDAEIFEDNGNPGYYGDVYSMLLRLGGRIRRIAGVIAVVEDQAV